MTPNAAKPSPVLLSGGRQLNEWIEAGGSPDQRVNLRRLRHRWFGAWFERHLSITAQRCATVQLPKDPVFIVGLWRTGSTALHLALTQATGWTTPRTWQCFHPADFLLMSPPALQSAIRPMDAGLVDTFSAQEDEFASLLLGERSSYRAFIDPRRFGEMTEVLIEWRDQNCRGLSDRWEVFLKAIIMRSPGPLLLKSPNHTFRLPWLCQRFPHAKFIWLTRSATDVLESNRRMWNSMIDRYGQWQPDATGLDRFLRRAMAEHDEILDWARKAIADRLVVAKFDDLMSDGSGLIGRILASFQISIGSVNGR